MSTVGIEGSSRLSPHVRGHLLLFERRPAPAIPSAKLIAGAVILEVLCPTVVGPLAQFVPLWVLFPALLALSLVIVRATGTRLSDLGLRPWHEWSTTEKSYFFQVLVIANVVFPLVLARSILARLEQIGDVAQSRGPCSCRTSSSASTRKSCTAGCFNRAWSDDWVRSSPSWWPMCCSRSGHCTGTT